MGYGITTFRLKRNHSVLRRATRLDVHPNSHENLLLCPSYEEWTAWCSG